MEILRKRNDRRAGVEHDAANPALAYGVRERLQTAHVATAERGARLDFHTHKPARIVFQDQIHFLT